MKIEKMDTEDKKLFEEMYLEYEVYLRRIAYVNDIPVDYIEDVVQDTLFHMPAINIPWICLRKVRGRC